MGKRPVIAASGIYLLAALVGHMRERSGAVSCGCSDACWCRHAPLALFRWVAPFGHRG
jgi:hypothetical protein